MGEEQVPGSGYNQPIIEIIKDRNVLTVKEIDKDHHKLGKYPGRFLQTEGNNLVLISLVAVMET